MDKFRYWGSYRRLDGSMSHYYRKACKKCDGRRDYKEAYRRKLSMQGRIPGERLKVYELHKEQIDAGTKERVNSREALKRRKRNPKHYQRIDERRAVYELHKEEIEGGLKEWRRVRQNAYYHTHAEAIRKRAYEWYKKKYPDEFAAREERKRQSKQRQEERKKAHVEWERKMAYFQTDEWKAIQKAKIRARNRERDRVQYHADPNVKKRQNKVRRGACLKLTDGYVKRMLCLGNELKATDIPQELIDAKREYIKLTRKLKGEQHEINERSQKQVN